MDGKRKLIYRVITLISCLPEKEMKLILTSQSSEYKLKKGISYFTAKLQINKSIQAALKSLINAAA